MANEVVATQGASASVAEVACLSVEVPSVADQVTCKEWREHHPEVVDPRVWRKLPQELVELVFARLPVSRIIELCKRSKAWSAMSKSSNFKQACLEGLPGLFGLLVWCDHIETISTEMHDVQFKEWANIELAKCSGRHGDDGSTDSRKWLFSDSDDEYASGTYENSMFACDGGLVCFVPHNEREKRYFSTSPIVVCNPWSRVWKTLPPLPLDDIESTEIILVQLVMEDDTEWYRVILVIREKVGDALSARFYYSRTGEWSIMDFGLVYGGCNDLWISHGVPFVFDCRTKKLYNLLECASLQGVDEMGYISIIQDRVFVLREPTIDGERNSMMYWVSEYAWDSSKSDLREVKVLESCVSVDPDHTLVLFATRGVVLLIGHKCMTLL